VGAEPPLFLQVYRLRHWRQAGTSGTRHRGNSSLADIWRKYIVCVCGLRWPVGDVV